MRHSCCPQGQQCQDWAKELRAGIQPALGLGHGCLNGVLTGRQQTCSFVVSHLSMFLKFLNKSCYLEIIIVDNIGG